MHYIVVTSRGFQTGFQSAPKVSTLVARAQAALLTGNTLQLTRSRCFKTAMPKDGKIAKKLIRKAMRDGPPFMATTTALLLALPGHFGTDYFRGKDQGTTAKRKMKTAMARDGLLSVLTEVQRRC
ncbi:MAG: hypothetical protein M1836_007789 [Candelina mexicana]|nr:MAG: hypothetical protein M1836_007789 [Candelina mexicana]